MIVYKKKSRRAREFRFWKYKNNFLLGEYKKSFFWENIRIFSTFELESSITANIRNFFRMSFSSFLGFGMESAGLHFRKYNKGFPLRKYMNFLILEQESSIFRNIRNFFRGEFFFVFGFGLKASQVALIYTTSFRNNC